MLICKGTQFLLSQMATNLELVGNARGRHMHSYGALVKDVWLSIALSIDSVPIDLTYLARRKNVSSARAFHGPRARAISGTSVILGTLALSREPQTAKPKQNNLPNSSQLLFGYCSLITLLRTTRSIKEHKTLARRISGPQWKALPRAWPRSTQYICSPKREPQMLVMERL